MPAVYLMAGIVGGLIAAVSSSGMGHTALFALLAYSVAGVICILGVATFVPGRRNDDRQD